MTHANKNNPINRRQFLGLAWGGSLALFFGQALVAFVNFLKPVSKGGFGGMVFSWLSGRVIDSHGYMPVLVGYGIMPLIALAILLGFCGPLTRDRSLEPEANPSSPS